MGNLGFALWLSDLFKERLPHKCLPSDRLIAKVDGHGYVDLPRIFRKFWPPHLYIFLHIFDIFHFLGSKIDRVMDGGRLRRPPLINYQF